MPKFCSKCKLPYDDDLKSCPYCDDVVDVFRAGDSPSTNDSGILVEVVEAAEEPMTSSDDVIDLGGLEEDVAATGSGVEAAEPGTGESSLIWSSLVEEIDREAEAASALRVDSPSDADLLRTAGGSSAGASGAQGVVDFDAHEPPLELGSGISGDLTGSATAGADGSGIDLTGLGLVGDEPGISDPAAARDLLNVAPSHEPSLSIEDSSTELGRDAVVVDEASAINLTEADFVEEVPEPPLPVNREEWISDEPEESPSTGTSMVDLGAPDPTPGVASDLKLVPEAMESHASGLDDDVLDLSTPGASGSGTSEVAVSDLDLTGDDSEVPAFSEVELAEDVDLLGESEPVELHEEDQGGLFDLGHAESGVDLAQPFGDEGEDVLGDQTIQEEVNTGEEDSSAVDLGTFARNPLESRPEPEVEPEPSSEDESVDLEASADEDEEGIDLAAASPSSPDEDEWEPSQDLIDTKESPSAVMALEGDPEREGTFEGVFREEAEGMAVTSAPELVVADEDEAPPSAPKKPAKAAAERRRGGSLATVGTLVLGILIGGAGLYGAILSNLLQGIVPVEFLPTVGGGRSGSGALVSLPPQQMAQPPQPQPQPPVNVAPPAAVPAAADPVAQLRTGNFDGAVAALQQVNPDDKQKLAARGEARWLRSLQRAAVQHNGDPAKIAEALKNDEEVKNALADLTAANNADAWYWQAEIAEWLEGPEKARGRVEEALKQVGDDPVQKRRFQAALHRLNLAVPGKPGGAVRRTPPLPSPAEFERRLVAVLVALQQPEAGPPPGQPGGPPPGTRAPEDEAGFDFWKALHDAHQGNYADAIKALEEAKKKHEVLRFKRLRQAQNPLSDPTEKIFLETCNELAQRWKVEQGYREALKGLNDAGYTALAADLAGGKPAAEVLKNIAEAVKDAAPGKLDPSAVKAADLAAAVKGLADARAAERERVEAVVAELKAAGVGKFKDLAKPADFTGDKAALAEAVKQLAADGGSSRTDLAAALKKATEESAKVAAVVEQLKGAGVDAKPTKESLAAAVKEVAADREKVKTELAAANKALDAALTPLVDGGFLPAGSDRSKVPAGLAQMTRAAQHPAVSALADLAAGASGVGSRSAAVLQKGFDQGKQLAALNAEKAMLQTRLMQRWDPAQLLPVWRAVLDAAPTPEMVDMARQDMERAQADKPRPEVKCLEGLVARGAGQYDEARKALSEFSKAEAGTVGEAWEKAGERALKELTDLSARYLPAIHNARASRDVTRALTLTEEALKVFPKDGFPREHASLLATRSLLRLEQGEGVPNAETLQASQKDADDAIAGGAVVQGNFAKGRIAEAAGDLAAAEKAYQEALKACPNAAEAGPEDLQQFAKAHPGCDPTGNRYRVALGRVVLEQTRRRPAPAPEKKEEKVGSATTLTQQLIYLAGGFWKSMLLTVAWIDPADVAAAEGQVPPSNPRLEQAIQQARKALEVNPNDQEAMMLLGQALAQSGEWKEGLDQYVAGLKKTLPPERARDLDWLMANHPAFKLPFSGLVRDPLRAEGQYAIGLRLFFERRFDQAERALETAVRLNDQDARYLYFLGLSMLPQEGKEALAREAFRRAALLELQDRPTSAAVNAALERIQGPTRFVVNRVRDKILTTEGR